MIEKTLLLVIVLLSQFSFADSNLVGRWDYYSYIYNGHEQIPRDKNTKMFFEFDDDGNSRLQWYNEVEGLFCDRKGLYRLDSGTLIEEVVWVNPHNSSVCNQDLDMRLGRKTKSSVRVERERFEMDIPLGDGFITYVWKKSLPEQ